MHMKIEISIEPGGCEVGSEIADTLRELADNVEGYEYLDFEPSGPISAFYSITGNSVKWEVS